MLLGPSYAALVAAHPFPPAALLALIALMGALGVGATVWVLVTGRGARG